MANSLVKLSAMRDQWLLFSAIVPAFTICQIGINLQESDQYRTIACKDMQYDKNGVDYDFFSASNETVLETHPSDYQCMITDPFLYVALDVYIYYTQKLSNAVLAQPIQCAYHQNFNAGYVVYINSSVQRNDWQIMMLAMKSLIHVSSNI